MEPKRKLVLRNYSEGQKSLKIGDYVWLLEEKSNGKSLIEYKDIRLIVPSEILTDTPVPIPIAKLKELDPCFGNPIDTFREIYKDSINIFRILECKHGNLFLEDTTPGIVWITRLIYIGKIEHNEIAYYNIWNKYCKLSNDELHIMEIGM
jgi:hypothetical protein